MPTLLRVRLSCLAIATAVVASACGGQDPPDNDLATVLCDSPEGTWTNLNDEPAGIRDVPTLVTWTDEVGCLINGGFLFHRMGDEHCGLEDAEFISLGLPVGTPYTGPNADPPGQDWEPEFFFNTDGAWESEPNGVEVSLSDIPTDATELGLKGSGGRTLFISTNDSMLWVASGDVVRRFVRPSNEIACA